MLKHAALIVLAFVVLILSASIALTLRGGSELKKSDAAFHDGDLATSLVHARAAALSYVPGSEHVLGACERLEAIAVGAEAKGDLALARRAWETLRQVHAQTNYPGRPQSDQEKRAQAALLRVDQAVEAAGQ